MIKCPCVFNECFCRPTWSPIKAHVCDFRHNALDSQNSVEASVVGVDDDDSASSSHPRHQDGVARWATQFNAHKLDTPAALASLSNMILSPTQKVLCSRLSPQTQPAYGKLSQRDSEQRMRAIALAICAFSICVLTCRTILHLVPSFPRALSNFLESSEQWLFESCTNISQNNCTINRHFHSSVQYFEIVNYL